MDEKKIAHFMQALSLTREEAIDLIEADKEVDRMKDGQVDNDLTTEQKKAKKKAMNNAAGGKKKPNVYNFEAKPKKKDDEKEEFISKLFELVAKFTKNCVIVNTNREISFDFGENNYSLTLTKHRKPTKK